MKFVEVLSGILNHPLNQRAKMHALYRFFWWQAFSRIARRPLVWTWIEGAKLVIERGMTGATGNLYNGLHEFSDMGFLLHFLRADDLMVDVGANVGAYTTLASVVGRARVIAFEPVPTTFQHLSRNVLVNSVSQRVTLIQAAVGSSAGSVRISLSFDAANHVQQGWDGSGEEVRLVALDQVLNEIPILLKIDVEGFETEVIHGAERVLKDTRLKAVIIELNGLGSRYGFQDSDLHDALVRYGFQAFAYDPFVRGLSPQLTWGKHNTLYIRDLEFIRDRVAAARVVKVNSYQL